MAINENNSQKTQKENLESEEYNNSKEKHQFSSYDNKFLDTNKNNNMNSNITNKSVQFLKEKYIIDKEITKYIIIDEFDESIDLPIKIIYDNHTYIITSHKPKG